MSTDASQAGGRSGHGTGAQSDLHHVELHDLVRRGRVDCVMHSMGWFFIALGAVFACLDGELGLKATLFMCGGVGFISGALVARGDHGVRTPRRRAPWLLGAILVAVMFACVLRVPCANSAARQGDFVWDGLPDQEWQGRVYRWPGFWSADYIVPPGESAIDWYCYGTTYVPLPSDSTRQAAARVARFLTVRFGLHKDPAWLESRLSLDRSPEGRVDVEADVWRHPYAEALNEIDGALATETRQAVRRRSVFGALLAFLLAMITLRLALVLGARAVVLTAAAFLTLFLAPVHAAYRVYTLLLPVLRLHEAYFATVSTVFVVASVGFWVWSLIALRPRDRVATFSS